VRQHVKRSPSAQAETKTNDAKLATPKRSHASPAPMLPWRSWTAPTGECAACPANQPCGCDGAAPSASGRIVGLSSPVDGAQPPAADPLLAQPADAAAQQPDTPAQPGAAPAKGLIAEDDAGSLSDGQMRRSDFLASARAALASRAHDRLSDEYQYRIEPALDGVSARYGSLGAAALEAELQKSIPGAASAKAAADYIPMLTDYAVSVGTKQGGAPAMQLKARDGKAGGDHDPRAVRAELGAGRPLDGSVRAGLESAYRQSFADVQVHDDARADAVAARVGARALTVGEHVAFARGEYRPGTPIGDAILAHELAHVVQQRSGVAAGPLAKSDGAESALESDADTAAVGAVASLVGRRLGVPVEVAAPALPAVKSRLRLSRCDPMHQTGTSPKGTPTGVSVKFDYRIKPPPRYDAHFIVTLTSSTGSPGDLYGLSYAEELSATRDDFGLGVKARAKAGERSWDPSTGGFSPPAAPLYVNARGEVGDTVGFPQADGSAAMATKVTSLPAESQVQQKHQYQNCDGGWNTITTTTQKIRIEQLSPGNYQIVMDHNGATDAQPYCDRVPAGYAPSVCPTAPTPTPTPLPTPTPPGSGSTSTPQDSGPTPTPQGSGSTPTPTPSAPSSGPAPSPSTDRRDQ
jgi:hypothetical protein